MRINSFHIPRRQMVERQLVARGIKDPRVLEAMAKVPRHLFVEEALSYGAYGDCPLPIGEGQTISQPFIVATMTEALKLSGSEAVLEIGTGSGYQTAILAELSYRVYTIERIRPFMVRSRQLLDRLGYRNVAFKHGDGTCGWAEQGPFEAIIVTAGAPDIPSPLLEHLAPGGRMVVPVGESKSVQNLVRLAKDSQNRVRREELGDCRFVELIGQYGWPERIERR